MALFLDDPRYAFGCLGFYTERLAGRRIVQIAAFITGLAVIAAFVGGISPVKASPGSQALFLVISAWVLVSGLMRLLLTGAMWVCTIVFDWIAEGVTSLASAMHYLRRAYWIGTEIFLSTAFLATLITATLVGFGVLSINEEAEHAAPEQPIPAAHFR
jgi:hypothetical protein